MLQLTEEIIRDLVNEKRKPNIGIKTGFTDLDFMTNGLQKGNLYLLAGDYGIGKTTLSLNTANYIMVKRKEAVLYYSLKESISSLITMLLTLSTGIEQWRMSCGKLLVEEDEKILNTIQLLGLSKMYIETEHPSVEEMCEAIKVMVEENSIKLVIIDGMNLLYSEQTYGNKELELTYICSALKRVAEEMKVPILLLSNLNKNETDILNYYGLYNIPFFRLLETTIDTIMILEDVDDCQNNEHVEVERDLKIVKNKNGPNGIVKLIFESTTGRFSDKKQF